MDSLHMGYSPHKDLRHKGSPHRGSIRTDYPHTDYTRPPDWWPGSILPVDWRACWCDDNDQTPPHRWPRGTPHQTGLYFSRS